MKGVANTDCLVIENTIPRRIFSWYRIQPEKGGVSFIPIQTIN